MTQLEQKIYNVDGSVYSTIQAQKYEPFRIFETQPYSRYPQVQSRQYSPIPIIKANEPYRLENKVYRRN